MTVAGTFNTTLGKRFQWLDRFDGVPLSDRADTRKVASRSDREYEDWGRDWPFHDNEKRDWFSLFVRADDDELPVDDEWEPLYWTVRGLDVTPPLWRSARCCLTTIKATGGGSVSPAASEARKAREAGALRSSSLGARHLDKDATPLRRDPESLPEPGDRRAATRSHLPAQDLPQAGSAETCPDG